MFSSALGWLFSFTEEIFPFEMNSKPAKSASDFSSFYFKTTIFNTFKKGDLERKKNFYRTKRKVPKVIYCLRYFFSFNKEEYA